MQKTTKMKFFYLYNNTVREYLSRENQKNIESGNSLYFWRCNAYKVKQNEL